MRVMKLNKDIKIEAAPEQPVKELRAKVAAELDVQPNQLKIIANGKILKDEQTLEECHVCASTKVTVAITKATVIETKTVAPIPIQAQPVPMKEP